MTSPRDHHPSELLRPWLRGRLSEQDAAAVEAHLQQCPECRSEKQALELLLADTPAMDDIERARVRRGVAEAVGSAAATAPPPKRASRLAPVVGAAATIVLLVAGVAYFAAVDGGDDASEGAPTELGDAGERFDAAEGDRADEDDETARDVAEEGAAAQAQGEAEPVFHRNAGDLRVSRLRRAGSSGSLFAAFTSAYDTTAATPARQRKFVESLARRAPDPATGAQIRACAETVFSAPPGEVLPAYGAVGRFEGDRALVLGFVHAAEPGPLDRFMFWAWPAGECGAILHYEAGRIGD